MTPFKDLIRLHRKDAVLPFVPIKLPCFPTSISLSKGQKSAPDFFPYKHLSQSLKIKNACSPIDLSFHLFPLLSKTTKSDGRKNKIRAAWTLLRFVVNICPAMRRFRVRSLYGARSVYVQEIKNTSIKKL